MKVRAVTHALEIHLLLERIMIAKSMWISMQEMGRLPSGNRESQWPDETCLTCTHNVLVLGNYLTKKK